MEIELELKSSSKDVGEVLDKVSQLVKKSQELGFQIDELDSFSFISRTSC